MAGPFVHPALARHGESEARLRLAFRTRCVRCCIQQQPYLPRRLHGRRVRARRQNTKALDQDRRCLPAQGRIRLLDRAQGISHRRPPGRPTPIPRTRAATTNRAISSFPSGPSPAPMLLSLPRCYPRLKPSEAPMPNKKHTAAVPIDQIGQSILILRGQRVLLDSDLALYTV
jgi:hypothetical protein